MVLLDAFFLDLPSTIVCSYDTEGGGMIVFRCDICGKTEDKKSTVFKLADRNDICRVCLKHLDMAADLLSVGDFRSELEKIHHKVFPEKKGG